MEETRDREGMSFGVRTAGAGRRCAFSFSAVRHRTPLQASLGVTGHEQKDQIL